MKRFLAGAAALCTSLALSAQVKTPIPEDLDEVVFGARKQVHADFAIQGIRFRGIPSLDGKPVLLWNADAKKPLVLAQDRTRVADWLRQNAGAFGFGDFVPVFARSDKFRSLDYLEFGLARKGRRLLDTQVRVYFKAGAFVGLWHNFPLPLLGLDGGPVADVPGKGEVVWFAERRGVLGYRLVPGRVERVVTGGVTTDEIRTAKGVAYTLVHPQKTVDPNAAPTFNEYSVPVGSFPDQIWADSTGIIWISQPNSGYVTSFAPSTKKWTQYATAPGRGADGLWCDDEDRVWTGMYYTRQLGMLDVPTKKLTLIPMPYTPSSPAIPSPSSQGTVWVTDHAYNRISEYNPATKKWVGSHVMPITRTWVVEGTLDPGTETVWFTGYFSNTMPFKPLGKAIGNVAIPSRGGPAFLAYRDGRVWFSLWNANRCGYVEVATNKVVEFAYRAGERGGPMSMLPTGEAVVGTRSAGYIVVLDPVKKTFREFKIPTSTGLKDGLTVSPDGTIWFTGTYRNKIAQLVLK